VCHRFTREKIFLTYLSYRTEWAWRVRVPGISRKLLWHFSIENIFFRERYRPACLLDPVRMRPCKGVLSMGQLFVTDTRRRVVTRPTRQKDKKRSRDDCLRYAKLFASLSLFSLSVNVTSFQNAICKVAQSSLHQVSFSQMSKGQTGLDFNDCVVPWTSGHDASKIYCLLDILSINIM